MLTSRYTLDSISADGREAIGAHADFLGAVRLPSSAHNQEAGTRVVTDILVLRGREPGHDPNHADGFLAAPDRVDGVRMSSYFGEYPEHVLGGVTTRSGRFSTPELEITGSLDEALESLPTALGQITEGRFSKPTAPAPAAHTMEQRVQPPAAIPGSFRLTDVHPEVFDVQEGWIPATKQVPEVTRLIKIRDALDATLAADQSGQDATGPRTALQAAYDDYRSRHGALTRSTTNPKTGRTTRPRQGGFRADPRWPAVSALETIDNGTGEIVPAQIITAPVPVTAEAPSHATTDTDALMIALGHTQRVDLDFIGQLRNEPGTNVMERLEATGEVFADPGTGVWMTRSDFLSGPVRERHREVSALDKTDSRRAPYLESLEEVIPAPATADDLWDTMGGSWVPIDLTNQFVQERIGGYDRHDRASMCEITYDTEGGWNVLKRRGAVTARWETDRVDAHKLVEAALNGTSVTVRDSNDDGSSWVNEAATAEATDMIEQIREEWDRWSFEDPERAETLIETYTELYRSHVPRDYSDVPVSPQGLDAEWQLRPHQEAAIARILQSGDSLLAHPVGAGKTAEMVIAGAELRRTGQIGLPAYAVPGHMLDQFAGDITRLYPSARVLTLRSQEITPANRERLGAQLLTGDWDAVVMTHGTLRKWPLSPEAQQRRLDDRLVEIDAAMEQAAESARGEGDADNKAATSSVKKLQRQRENAVEKAKEELAKVSGAHDDHPFFFDRSPIDWIAVDEAHLFKNYPSNSKARIAGIATAESQRSVDLMDKLRTLRETRPGSPVCALATGTPVSNTAGELWVMAKFVDPTGLQRLNIESFDQWRAMFAKTTSAMELGRDGALAPKERLAQYRGLRQMARWTSEWADIVRTEDLGLPLPELRGGERIIHELEPDPDLAEWIAGEAVDRARALKGGMVDPTEDNHLKLDHDVSQASFDWHGFMDVPEDTDFSLVYAAASGIAEEWHAHKDDVFTTNTGAEHPRRGATHIAFSDVGTPKKGRHHTVYDRLRDHLVDLGVPREQIGFVHEHDKDDATKEAFFEQIRNGEISVVVGSTEKMGMGTNVQTRLASLHHLSCPHKPSDIEQREGRILRQGNQNPEVSVHAYVVKRTGSIQQWQRVERKANFVSQVMNASIDGDNRTGKDDPDLIGFAALKEASTGDPDFGLQNKLDGEVRQLSQLEARHRRAQDSARRSLPDLDRKLGERTRSLSDNQAIVDVVGTSPGGMTWYVDGQEAKTADIVAITRKWTANRDTPGRNTEKVTAKFDRSDTELRLTLPRGRWQCVLEGPNGNQVGQAINPGRSANEALENLALLRRSLQLAGERVGIDQGIIDKYEVQRDQQQEKVEEAFRHGDRLSEARAELDDVSRRLLTRYADPGVVERLDRVLGGSPPGNTQMDQAWANLRNEGVARPELLRRWEALTDGSGREPEAVDPQLQGFDGIVDQLHRNAQRTNPQHPTAATGRARMQTAHAPDTPQPVGISR